jgi:hypothetical protein
MTDLIDTRHEIDPANRPTGLVDSRENLQIRMGGTALNDRVDLSEEHVAEQTWEDAETVSSKVVEVIVGEKKLNLVSFFDGDPDYAELSDTIVQKRQQEYKRARLLQPSAKAGDDIRGDNVEIYALIDPESGEPVASLRKVHASELGAVDELPSYKKFQEAGTLDPSGDTLLRDRAADRPVVEIAALWKDTAYDSEATLLLYRRALHDSIEKGEVWFMGVVSKLHRNLTRTFGDQVVRTIGAPTPVTGEDAQEQVRINPTIVDPLTFFDDLLFEVNKAKASGDQQAMYDKDALWWYFADELSKVYIKKMGVSHGS